jgi:aminoglycoside phosphotransferase (APT) family kinase protein
MPPRETLSWAASAIGAGTRIVLVRSLPGKWAATHAIDVDDRYGRRHRLVLRRWARPGWREDPEFTAAHEAAVLDRLSAASIPVPELVAVDPEGDTCDFPALLMTRLPGRPPTPRASRRPDVLGPLVETLVEIHRLDAGLGEVAAPFAPFHPIDSLRPPPDSARPELWSSAIQLAAAEPSPSEARFIHRDFHPGNTLWEKGALTGIVDWTSASLGPPAADLGHLLANLAMLHGAEVASAARAAYLARVESTSDPWYWELRMLLDFVPDVDRDDLAEGQLDRLEGYLHSLIETRD